MIFFLIQKLNDIQLKEVREMHISEAAKLAADQGRLMVRKSVISRSDTVFGAVQPTNSYERCKLIVFKEDETRSCRCWNPTQADLVADDWELLGNEFTNKISNRK